MVFASWASLTSTILKLPPQPHGFDIDQLLIHLSTPTIITTTVLNLIVRGPPNLVRYAPLAVRHPTGGGQISAHRPSTLHSHCSSSVYLEELPILPISNFRATIL